MSGEQSRGVNPSAIPTVVNVDFYHHSIVPKPRLPCMVRMTFIEVDYR